MCFGCNYVYAPQACSAHWCQKKMSICGNWSCRWEAANVGKAYSVLFSLNDLFSLLFYYHKPQFYILLLNCNIGMFIPFYVMKLTEHILHFVHLIFTTQRTWCMTEIDNTLCCCDKIVKQVIGKKDSVWYPVWENSLW